MTDLSTDRAETAIEVPDNGVVPVLVTFALLFLLSAAVWFVLDRIRADEVRTAEISQTNTEHHASQPAKAQPRKVAVTK